MCKEYKMFDGNEWNKRILQKISKIHSEFWLNEMFPDVNELQNTSKTTEESIILSEGVSKNEHMIVCRWVYLMTCLALSQSCDDLWKCDSFYYSDKIIYYPTDACNISSCFLNNKYKVSLSCPSCKVQHKLFYCELNNPYLAEIAQNMPSCNNNSWERFSAFVALPFHFFTREKKVIKIILAYWNK